MQEIRKMKSQTQLHTYHLIIIQCGMCVYFTGIVPMACNDLFVEIESKRQAAKEGDEYKVTHILKLN